VSKKKEATLIFGTSFFIDDSKSAVFMLPNM